MRTLIVYNDLERDLQFSIVEGDYGRFDGIMFNAGREHPFESECMDFIFDEVGNFKIQLSENKSLVKNKEWDEVAFITFLP